MFNSLAHIDTKNKMFKHLGMLPGFNIVENPRFNESISFDMNTTMDNNIINETIYVKLIGSANNTNKQSRRKRKQVTASKSRKK